MGLFDVFKKKKPASSPRPPIRPFLRAGMLPPHPEPQADNNFIIVILDSLRYDSFMEAKPKIITKLGRVERRFSYASWTPDWTRTNYAGCGTYWTGASDMEADRRSPLRWDCRFSWLPRWLWAAVSQERPKGHPSC